MHVFYRNDKAACGIYIPIIYFTLTIALYNICYRMLGQVLQTASFNSQICLTVGEEIIEVA
jgi:hypothetical protein